MKIKLITEVNNTPAGSIVEVNEIMLKSLNQVDYVEYTDDVAKTEQKVAIKNFKEPKVVQNKKVNIKMSNEVKYPVGSMIKKIFTGEIDYKAVVGQSEAGSGTGAELVYTGLAQLQNAAFQGSVFVNKCTKLSLAPSQSAIAVPIDASNMYVKATSPQVYNMAEGDQKTVSVPVLRSITVTPKKHVVLQFSTDELLMDDANLEAIIMNWAYNKLAAVADGAAIVGPGYATDGFHSLDTVGTNYVSTQTISNLAAPTFTEISGFVKKINPAYLNGAEWFMSIDAWQGMQITAATASSANPLYPQIFDIVGKKLMGYPVNVMPQINADVFFGNPKQYAFVQAGETRMDKSIHFYFDTDQTGYRLVARFGGCPLAACQTAADSVTIGAFCKRG